ncbi:astakine-like [Odontomachus brunneus]|uniref:astakine-like n=1 Tax=Odontomachus brunneus TaxID=486640 RepID=UPI0013F1F41E|nr:astakine-like [Odontomachus brunneus]
MSPILGILLITTVALASPFSDNVCTTNSDCSSDKCCLLPPSRYAIPNCMPLQQKGDQCRINANTITTNLTYPDNSQLKVVNVHYILCPCATGLSCNLKNGICE